MPKHPTDHLEGFLQAHVRRPLPLSSNLDNPIATKQRIFDLKPPARRWRKHLPDRRSNTGHDRPKEPVERTITSSTVESSMRDYQTSWLDFQGSEGAREALIHAVSRSLEGLGEKRAVAGSWALGSQGRSRKMARRGLMTAEKNARCNPSNQHKNSQHLIVVLARVRNPKDGDTSNHHIGYDGSLVRAEAPRAPPGVQH
ncbi:uncharacterized protein N7482_006270 [Penicillium canariense]|uniref:Uncharacterized protein n=1 Tax=Penicillium canariense TaxID=189055 RepID=A0A9W9I3V9_9EURO|nr:uncharacterized protein N7482_006270 [Penicillium canariense]KAJ5167489.1 hypothetical protein N7482_006270 [Penicillium canariense]